MIALLLFHCTVHALKYFCGVRGGLFVLITSDFKNTKEVAQKGTSLVTFTPSSSLLKSLLLFLIRRKSTSRRTFMQATCSDFCLCIQSVLSLAFNLSSVTLQVLDLFFFLPFSFPLAYSAQPCDSMTNLSQSQINQRVSCFFSRDHSNSHHF